MTAARFSIVLALLAGVGACGGEPDLSAHSAWVRLTPPGTTTAAYLNIVNRLDRPVRLTGAQADGFGAVMIHETRIVDGQASMSHAAPVVVAPNQALALRPGGVHLMLMQPQIELAAGDTVRIVLRFEDRPPLTVDATVRVTPP